MDLIVRNGVVVTASSIARTDIAIKEGRIVQIGGEMPMAVPAIDAGGRYVLPGGVDVHTHLDAPGPIGNTADDFFTGTRAALAGGTTTIVDFCAQTRGESLAAALEQWHAKAKDKAVADYGFHIIVLDMTPAVLAELAKLPDQGVTSFKLFMAYRGAQMVDDAALIQALEAARQAGALVMVHAENGDAAEHLVQKHLARGETAPRYHALSRPPRVEAEATARAIALAEIVGTPIYIVHVSGRDALEEVVRARLRGVQVRAETCAHYLYASAADLDTPDFEGAKFVFTPPPRTPDDQAAIWNALSQGMLDAVSSDHAGWSFALDKALGRDDFSKIPNGAPGIEERMIVTYQGVNTGRLSINRFVDLVATTPARLFGLFPQKGTIAVGSDADLVIWDPEAEATIRQDALHHAVDYTLHEGRRVRGLPVTVIRRGEVVVRDGEFLGRPGTGHFLHRARYARA